MQFLQWFSIGIPCKEASKSHYINSPFVLDLNAVFNESVHLISNRKRVKEEGLT